MRVAGSEARSSGDAERGALGSLALAPVTITPTKPLTPSHVKGLLWLDVMRKGTSELVETAYVWNSRTPCLSAQTLAFWEYLDRTVGEAAWDRCTERELGELYVRCHAQAEPPGFDALRPYLDRVEAEGWTHPASRRLIDLWLEQLGLLAIEDPGMAVDRAPGLSAADALDLLDERGLLVDHRRFGGPAYVDGARWGLPLRQLVGEDGHANYVLAVLRELIPLIGRHDRFLLAFDEELAEDYVLIDRVLCELGASVSRLALGRVPIDGAIRSSRHGGWEGHTLADLSRLCLEQFDLPAYRLGMRIYFIAILKRSSPQSFRPELLRRSLLRAQRIIETPGSGSGDDDYLAFLRDKLADGGYVDPHRLTTSLLDRHRRVPTERLVRSVFL
ncbi:MAG: hypothetical protein ACRDK9_08490 [Solirubrobacterales bacterium]